MNVKNSRKLIDITLERESRINLNMVSQSHAAMQFQGRRVDLVAIHHYHASNRQLQEVHLKD